MRDISHHSTSWTVNWMDGRIHELIVGNKVCVSWSVSRCDKHITELEVLCLWTAFYIMGPSLLLLQHHSIFIFNVVLVILDEKEGVSGMVDGRYGVVACHHATQHSYFD